MYVLNLLQTVTHVLQKHEYLMFGSLVKQGTLCPMPTYKMDKPSVIMWACNQAGQSKMIENKVRMAWLGPVTDLGGTQALGPFLFF